MDNKNLPENENVNLSGADESVFDEDTYMPEKPDDELSDDDLDISELLRKYLPDFTPEDEPEDNLDPSEIVANAEASSAEAPIEGSGDIPDAADVTAEAYDEEYDGEYAEVSEDAGFDEYQEETAEADASYEEYYEDQPGEDLADDGEDYSEYAFDSGDGSYDEPAEPAEVPFLTDNDPEIPEDSELDATDINLMVAFGLDDELARTMGKEVAAKIAEEIDSEAKEHEEKVRRSVENEYLDPTQTPEVAGRLKKRHSHLKAKVVFASLFTILLLLYENLEIFGIQFGGALNPAVYPVVYIMMSLQIMLICAAVGYEQILGGCADLFTGKIGPSSIAFIGNVAAIAYSVILAETTVIPNEPTLFNACAASMTVFALVHDLITAKRDILSFNIVSSKRPKYAIRFMSAADAGIPGGLFEDDDVSEGGVLRIEKTKFVDDFFYRTSTGTKAGRGFSAAYLFISAIIAAVMGVYAGMTSETVGAMNAAFVTFFATMPLSLFIAMGYPFYKGVSDAYDMDGTILGESSAEEYAEAGAVCFDDIDAFPSYGVKVQNIKIYNNHRIDRVLYYAASAFKAAGGPLADVFEVATMEIGTSENVVVEAAADGYLGVSVDDKSIIFGTADSLREYGINLPDSVTEEDQILSGELCPMYMLREGKLMAKLLVKYMLDSDFEFLLKELSDEGMCACIKTFDPNIDDALVTMKLGGGRYPFRVLRYNDTGEIRRINDRMSGGIVSRGTTKPLLQMIGSCSKMLGMRKAGFTVGVVSAIIAALVAWVLITSGGFTSMSSIAVVIYQILWALPVILTTKMFLR